MKNRKVVILVGIIFLSIFITSPIHAQQVKKIMDLRQDELDVFNSICAKVLKDYFGDRILSWAKTTYKYLPTSDDSVASDIGDKLDKPITLISAIILETYRYNEIKSDLKERVSQLAAKDRGREHGILKSLVLTSPSGGTMSMSYKSITIVPLLVYVK